MYLPEIMSSPLKETMEQLLAATPVPQPFKQELEHASEDSMGIIRPHTIGKEVTLQKFISLVHPITTLLDLGNRGLPQGCLTVVEAPSGNWNPFWNQLIGGASDIGYPIMVLPNSMDLDGAETHTLPIWDQATWSSLRPALQFHLMNAEPTLICIPNGEIVPTRAAMLWLLHQIRSGGHSLITTTPRPGPWPADYLISTTEKSLSSKEEAKLWGGTYRQRIVIMESIRGVTIGWNKPVRVELEPEFRIHEGTPGENQPNQVYKLTIR